MKIVFVMAFTTLVLGVFAGLYRSIAGPRRADRIMGINMIGSFSTLFLAILSVYFKEAWLLDICIVYALISFLAVVCLTKISISDKKGGKLDD